jgi:hypothetical protein
MPLALRMVPQCAHVSPVKYGRKFKTIFSLSTESGLKSIRNRKKVKEPSSNDIKVVYLLISVIKIFKIT